jgi:hypothetical protein
MTKIPRDIANELKERVFQKADEVGYISLSRNDSQDFMDELVRAEDIGQVIAQFRGNARVRTYIKDAILNRYSKDKARDARPSNLSTIIKQLFNHDAYAIEKDCDIDLYRFTDESEPHYIVVANGSYLKWETALRKALLYSPGKPFSKEGKALSIMLTLFCGGSRINNADKKHLREALSACNAKVYFYGENM